MKIYVTLAAKDPRANYGEITNRTFDHLLRMCGPIIELDTTLYTRAQTEPKLNIITRDKITVGASKSLSLGKERGIHLEISDSRSNKDAFEAKLSLYAEFAHPGLKPFAFKVDVKTVSRYITELGKVSTARILADELTAAIIKQHGERLKAVAEDAAPRAAYLNMLTKNVKRFLTPVKSRPAKESKK